MAKVRSNADLLAELASNEWKVRTAARSELDAWFAAHASEALSRARELATSALKRPRATQQAAGVVALPFLVKALSAGETLDPAYDVLVSGMGNLEVLRVVMLAIPEKRRLRIFERELDDDDSAMRLAEHLLDLAPDFTTSFLRHAFAKGDTVPSPLFDTWAKHVPEVKRQLKDHRAWMKAQPKAPPLARRPKPKGSLSFSDGIAIAPEDVASLDDVALAQWKLAAQAYLGGRAVKNAKDFVKRLIADDGSETDAVMRRWKVSRAGEHQFDFWVVLVDNGTLFEAGTSKRVPVQQVQGRFQALERGREWLALADELARSAPGDLWTLKPSNMRRRTR